MNISGPIKTLIAANAPANTALAGRVYPGVLEQESVYPCAAINIASDRAHNSKTAASTMDNVTVQIDVYGTTYATTSDAAALIRTAIDYASSGALEHIEFTGQQDMYSAKPELHRITQTYSIGYRG
jgi:hypothetical protein